MAVSLHEALIGDDEFEDRTLRRGLAISLRSAVTISGKGIEGRSEVFAHLDAFCVAQASVAAIQTEN